ncbi:acyl-CoA dehydrogenase family protein [Streptosporangium sp. NPDC006007]|uniref:acyl-CoA dehydrogenase family protein n=1 Tax=Streptosporangium sp. NPDC006007 TaxID=3154575 RepID=UPI0033A41F56
MDRKEGTVCASRDFGQIGHCAIKSILPLPAPDANHPDTVNNMFIYCSGCNSEGDDMRMRREQAADLVRTRWGKLLKEIGTSAADRYSTDAPPPKELFAAAGAAGLHGLFLPASLGGQDADAVTRGAVLEEIGYLCEDPAFPLLLSIHTNIALLVAEAGTQRLVHSYALPIARGERLPALAFSEGTDLFSMRTRAVTSGSGFRLSGHKEFITGGMLADVFLTYASTEQGDMIACLVEATDKGVEITATNGLGLRTAGTAQLTLNDVSVPAERVIAPTDGLSNAQTFLNSRRMSIASYTPGQMRMLLEQTVAQLHKRMRYGHALINLPNVQAAVGRMYVALETSRAMAYWAQEHFDQGATHPVFDSVISAAKYHSTKQALVLMDEVFRVLGGHAYYGDPRYGMYLRDYFGFIAGAGTQDLLEINLGLCASRDLTSTPRPNIQERIDVT